MGAKSQFTSDQEAWLTPVMIEYKAKLAASISSKDETLLDWKKSKCEDFLREFKTQLEATNDTISTWREVSTRLISSRWHIILTTFSASDATLYQHQSSLQGHQIKTNFTQHYLRADETKHEHITTAGRNVP